jgi:hypothetical protein
MEKAISYLARAEACQASALTADSDECKMEYWELALRWTELAAARRIVVAARDALKAK